MLDIEKFNAIIADLEKDLEIILNKAAPHVKETVYRNILQYIEKNKAIIAFYTNTSLISEVNPESPEKTLFKLCASYTDAASMRKELLSGMYPIDKSLSERADEYAAPVSLSPDSKGITACEPLEKQLSKKNHTSETAFISKIRQIRGAGKKIITFLMDAHQYSNLHKLPPQLEGKVHSESVPLAITEEEIRIVRSVLQKIEDWNHYDRKYKIFDDTGTWPHEKGGGGKVLDGWQDFWAPTFYELLSCLPLSKRKIIQYVHQILKICTSSKVSSAKSLYTKRYSTPDFS